MVVDIEDRAAAYQACYSTARLRPFTSDAAVPWLTELLEFMVGLYTVDRLVPRPKRGWSRGISFTFPVVSYERWFPLQSVLEELIVNSMGDDVTLNLRHRNAGIVHSDARAQGFALESPRPTTVGLLSDGLDSLCGAGASLAREPGAHAFVTVLTNSRRKHRISRLRTALQSVFGDRIAYCGLDVYLADGPRKQERTQRSRTLLAIAAGLTAAAAYRASQLEIYENGVGILNLPVPLLQMTHESSQVLHPRNLPLWSRITEQLLAPIGIVYPNRWYTKTQLCERLPSALHPAIAATSSCDAPQRRDAHADCGVCGSCMMRRLALQGAGLAHNDATYTLLPPQLPEFAASDVFPYHAALLAKALATPDPWPALLQLQPTLVPLVRDISDPAERAHTISDTIALLRRYVADVAVLRRLAHAV